MSDNIKNPYEDLPTVLRLTNDSAQTILFIVEKGKHESGPNAEWNTDETVAKNLEYIEFTTPIIKDLGGSLEPDVMKAIREGQKFLAEVN